MTILLLALPTLLLAALLVAFAYTFALGGRQADTGIKQAGHRYGANWTLWLTLALVASLELAKCLGAMPSPEPALMQLHLACALTYLGVLATMRFVITGVHYRTLHVWLGCAVATVFFVTALTGGIMLGQAYIAAS